MELDQYKNYVKINKIRGSYHTVGYSANVLSNLLHLRLKYIDSKIPKLDFNENILNKVLGLLEINHVNYILYDKEIIKQEYEDNAFDKYKIKYKRITNKGMNNVIEPRITGSVTVLYEGELDPETYIVGTNINSDSELIKKVMHYKKDDVVTLNSGIKFKIIDEDLVKNNE